MTTLLGVIEGSGNSCQACGHDIVWEYTIKLDGGATLMVGSDCAQRMLEDAGEVDQLDRLNSYKAKAEREYRQAQKGARADMATPKESESRAQFIERRIAEQRNAKLAFNTYIAWVRPSLYQAAVKLCRESGITNPSQQQQAEARELIIATIEKRYHANRADFIGKSPWQVK